MGLTDDMSIMGTRGLDWEEWAADQFFCLYVPVYVPEWTSDAYALFTLTTLSAIFLLPFSHTNSQALSEFMTNCVHLFKINMIKD